MRLAHVGRLTPRRDDRSQVGETLIEVLVAVTLMGIGFGAVISGIFTAVNVAERNQRYTKASIYLQAFAENVLQPARTPSSPADTFSQSLYIPCASVSSVGSYSDAGIGPAADTRPGPAWTAKVIKVEYLTGFSNPLPNLQKPIWSTNQANCMSQPSYASPPPGDVSRDKGLQRITLQVTNGDPSPARPVKDTITIVKRDRRCPPPNSYSNTDLGPC